MFLKAFPDRRGWSGMELGHLDETQTLRQSSGADAFHSPLPCLRISLSLGIDPWFEQKGEVKKRKSKLLCTPFSLEH